MKNDAVVTNPTTSPPVEEATPAQARGLRPWRERAIRLANSLSLWQLTVLAWGAWLLMCWALLGTPRNSNRGLTQIAESWGAIERVALWQNWLKPILPLYTLPPGVIAYSIRLLFILLFALQAIAFWRVLKSGNPSFWKWMIGPIGSHLTMAFMPPSNSDVFFYAMIGDLTRKDINPYLHQLQQFPDHPLYPYEHWIDIGVVYGPLWTNIAGIVMSLTGNDPVRAILGFKLYGAIIAMLVAGIVYVLGRYLTGRHSLAVAAAVLVAWQPNMVFESSGQVHNDATVMLFATAGIALVIMGGVAAVRAGLIVLAASFATKFVTLPLLGITALLRLAKPDTGRPDPRRIAVSWLLDGIGIAAVLVAAFLPYWGGIDTIREMLAEPGRLFAHPIWRIGEAGLLMLPSNHPVNIYRTILRFGMAILTFAIFAWITWHLIRVLLTRRSSGPLGMATTTLPSHVAWWTRPLLVAWSLAMVTLSMLPVNAHPWYWVWPVIPISLLVTMDLTDRDPADRHTGLPRWFTWYLVATMVMTIIYHTRIARF